MRQDTVRYFRLTCSACAASVLCGPEDMLARVRRCGMLRREKEVAHDLLVELFRSVVGQLVCSECGQAEMVAEPLANSDALWDDEQWGMDRPCDGCRKPIPAERLEIMPDARLCVDCQQAKEAEDQDDGSADAWTYV